MGELGELEKHLLIRSVQGQCPNKCSIEVIERRFLKSHLEEECPLQKIKCKFSHAGCRGEMMRQEIQDHLEEGKDKHLALISAKCEKLENELTGLKIAFTQIAPKPVQWNPSIRTPLK